MNSETANKYLLSFGAGVNSTAILALIHQGKLSYPNLRVVFADTGCEKPSTYCHAREMQKYFDIAILKSPLGTLYDYCVKYKCVPAMFLRWCTDKFKVTPINNWRKENGYEDATTIIGFCKGEERRMKHNDHEIYPLIEMGIDREGCTKIIEQSGWNVPEKSGCYICPFQRKIEWIALRENQPDLWNRAIGLERNSRGRYKIDCTIEEWIAADEGQMRLAPLENYQHCLCRSD